MSSVATWPSQIEDWLDERGKAAWITVMVLGFIAWWPIGLAILFYMIWSKRMSNGNCKKRKGAGLKRSHRFRETGNEAFDTYKAATLRRLEDEQEAFEAFLQRLREAKDKAEFDQFMDERSKPANVAPAEA